MGPVPRCGHVSLAVHSCGSSDEGSETDAVCTGRSGVGEQAGGSSGPLSGVPRVK